MAETEQSLAAMQKTMELVFIEVGKGLQAAKRDNIYGSQGSVQPDTMAIRRLDDKFQCAIDNIEEEIVRAKSILLRDLQQLRAKEAAATQPKPAPVPKAEETSENAPKEAPPMVPIVDFGARNPQSQFGGDGAADSTLDRLQKSIAHAQNIVRSPNTAGKELQSAKGADNSVNQASASDICILPNELLFNSPTETKDQPERSSADVSKNIASNVNDEVAKVDAQVANASKPSTEAPYPDAQENPTDIDSLFEEINSNQNTKESDNPDFADVGFTAGGDFAFPTTTAPTNNPDIDSPMTGMESYAASNNQTEDFNMLDFPNNTEDAAAGNGTTNADIFDFPNDNNGGSGGAGGGSSSDMDLGISTESSFDDLLEGMDFDADDGAGGGGMEHDGKFDAAFFGLS